MAGGYAGKIAFVDLTSGEIETEKLDESLARDFIGGQGLGARILFERQKKGADALGLESILGFTTGPLTGTKTPTGGRYMAVCKSPLTGGWGDANSGGYFGSELKAAGWDAVFVCGIASTPQYLMITDDKIELNMREGLKASDIKLPARMAGRPPQQEGPVAGVTLDVDRLAQEYRQAMGWDPESGRPDAATLEKLGLTQLINAHG